MQLHWQTEALHACSTLGQISGASPLKEVATLRISFVLASMLMIGNESARSHFRWGFDQQMVHCFLSFVHRSQLADEH